MKKILLPLSLIATSMGITKLSAYCVYNYSNEEKINLQIYSSKKKSEIGGLFNRKANYDLSPRGGKRCRNWKDFDKNNRKKQWYCVAFKGNWKLRHRYADSLLGEGYFPIGGAIVFAGYDENAKAKLEIYYDSKPWKWNKSPWNHKSQPWKTFKRR